MTCAEKLLEPTQSSSSVNLETTSILLAQSHSTSSVQSIASSQKNAPIMASSPKPAPKKT